jgi:hypothetical protein
MAITSITPKPATARCDPGGTSATRNGRQIDQEPALDPASDLLDTLVRLLARQAVAERMAAERNKIFSIQEDHRSRL